MSLDLHNEPSNLLLLLKGRSGEVERRWELTVKLFELWMEAREPDREDICQPVYVTAKCGALVPHFA